MYAKIILTQPGGQRFVVHGAIKVVSKLVLRI